MKLTKNLFGKLEEKEILLQKTEWYETNNIDVYLNERIVSVDFDKNEVIYSLGRRLGYSKLLIANGSTNFKPPIEGIDKKDVYTIRHLEDAWNLRTVSDYKNEVINIGGGIQGLETAWELSQHDRKVTIAEIQSRLMPNQLDERSSSILKSIIERYNIKVLLNTQVEKVVGNDKVEAVITKDGNRIECSILVYSVGIRPNIGFLKDTKIKINKGITVDEHMKTSIDNVYAAGDIAEFNGRVTGLWNIAIEQGKTAGYNLAGKETVYKNIVPVTTLNAFGISLFSMGEVNENECDKTKVEDNYDSEEYKRIFIRENKIVGAIVIGDIKKSPVLKAAIEEQKSIEDFQLSSMSMEDLLNRLKEHPKKQIDNLIIL